jgi:ABC-type uncharacterized transport system involved in gliding motility auxiliary subunit
MANIPMGAVFEGNFGGTISTKLVVIGDGDFAVPQQQGQAASEDGVNLLVNSIDWLSDDTGLIQLRTKGAEFRPLDELENSTKNWLKGFNFILPILLVIIYGVIRWRVRIAKRNQRREESYV